jgi:cold shock protein
MGICLSTVLRGVSAPQPTIWVVEAQRGSRLRSPYRSLSADRLGRPRETVGSVVQGKVKFFDQDRGFGFISREGGEDVFVHVSNLQAGGTSLAEGQAVEFEVGPGRKSEEAKNVRSV